jgi:hypothetical protein
MNTLERYIYKNKNSYSNILNDTYAEAENPIFKSFINIQSNRWQHVYIRTLLPTHSLHLSLPQDFHIATYIHVNTYRLHFTLPSITQQTHILRKL